VSSACFIFFVSTTLLCLSVLSVRGAAWPISQPIDRVDELLREGVGGGMEGGMRSRSALMSFYTTVGRGGAATVSPEEGGVRTGRGRRGTQHGCQHLCAKGVEDGIVGWESHRRLRRGYSGGIHAVEGMEIIGRISSTPSMESLLETEVCESDLYLPTKTHSPFWVSDLHLHRWR
jgi:hypothetical protein